MEAAGTVDAKNAPTAPWKTGRPVSHSYHRLSSSSSLATGKVLPMFPVNSVTYVPGCTFMPQVAVQDPPRWRAHARVPSARRSMRREKPWAVR